MATLYTHYAHSDIEPNRRNRLTAHLASAGEIDILALHHTRLVLSLIL